MISRLTAALLIPVLALAAMGSRDRLPDFGADGLAGLAADQVRELAAGRFVLPEGSLKTSRGTSLIEAAFVFDRPPQEVWRLLSETEVQDRYVSEIKSIGVVRKTEGENCLEFTVRVMGKTVVYRANHEFFPADLGFRWVLDPESRGDLAELAGFWRLFPFGEGRTLARYGSVVRPRLPVPGFIREALARKRVRPALEAVKKYVESDGVWRARGDGD